jgi:hypothetical protein
MTAVSQRGRPGRTGSARLTARLILITPSATLYAMQGKNTAS